MTQKPSDPLPLVSFKLLVRDLYVSPESLEYIQEVGEGEFALVEKGQLTGKAGEQHVVAVKSFKPYVVGTAEELRELVVAASLLKRLNHRHVADFYGVGCFSTDSLEAVRASVFFVEEFIGGYTLQKLLTEQMRNPYVRLYNTQVALSWCIQLAEALEYLHSTDPVTVHADVKSQNVFLTDEKLSDAEIRLADLKPHKHVYAKAPGSLLHTRPELPQASLMLCRTFRRPLGDALDDSAHSRAPSAASSISRAASLPTPDTAIVLQRHSSRADLDSAACSPASDGESPLPMAASTPDLLQVHAAAQRRQAQAPSAPSSPPSPRPAASAPPPSQPLPASPFAAAAPQHDTSSPPDQSPPSGVPSSQNSRESDPRQTAEVGFAINTSAPTHSTTAHAAPQPQPDLSGSGHNRSHHRPTAQEAEAEAAQPAARHMMECKQHGASQAFHALKAIHIISEEASASNNIQASANANPSASGRRVRFSQAPPQGKTPSRAWGRLYMAPEMVRGLKYNEKVDVFSFGVVMFELLQRSLLTCWVDPSVDPDVSLVRYAEKVAEGHREPLPKAWPQELKELVSSCWHPDPHLRPRMAEVVATLQRMATTPGFSDSLDNIRVMPPEYTEPSCKCVIC